MSEGGRNNLKKKVGAYVLTFIIAGQRTQLWRLENNVIAFSDQHSALLPSNF
jgi:hypothetical protein